MKFERLLLVGQTGFSKKSIFIDNEKLSYFVLYKKRGLLIEDKKVLYS